MCPVATQPPPSSRSRRWPRPAGSQGRTIVDAKSGVSGAGRGLEQTSHFSEVDGSLSAYGLAGHRHHPEMVQELSALQGASGEAAVTITFVPHLIPMTRGILATCYPTISRRRAARRILASASVRYASVTRSSTPTRPSSHVADAPPATKQTLGANSCLVYPTVDAPTGEVTVVSCIDNLVKGAAGGAVQCFNLMFDLARGRGTLANRRLSLGAADD